MGGYAVTGCIGAGIALAGLVGPEQFATKVETLGGQIVVGGAAAGAVGATAAWDQLDCANEELSASKVKDKDQSYKDILHYEDGDPNDGKVLYIGEFKGDLANGKGRLFWKDTQYEAFIGEFCDGLPVDGIFLNRAGFYIARMKRKNVDVLPDDPEYIETWELSGFQPDMQEDE